MRHHYLLLALVACGISDNKLLAELDEDDRARICDKVDAETFACEGTALTLDFSRDPESCRGELEVAADCEATVEDWRACDGAYREVLRQDPCASAPDECGWALGCQEF
jgi:hypothetical protein